MDRSTIARPGRAGRRRARSGIGSSIFRTRMHFPAFRTARSDIFRHQLRLTLFRSCYFTVALWSKRRNVTLVIRSSNQ